jgi:hypothetical protein
MIAGLMDAPTIKILRAPRVRRGRRVPVRAGINLMSAAHLRVWWELFFPAPAK